MKYQPESAPTEFLRRFGAFLESFQQGDVEHYKEIFESLHSIEYTDQEEILLWLAEELLSGELEFDELLEDYFDQVNAAS